MARKARSKCYEYQGAYLSAICRVSSPSRSCSESSAGKIIEGVNYDELGRRSVVSLPGGDRTYTYSDADGTRHLRSDAFAGPDGEVGLHYPARDELGNALSSWRSSGSGRRISASMGLERSGDSSRGKASTWRVAPSSA